MTSSPRKIRWGVLGYAHIARESVIPAIIRSSNSEFFALASQDEVKLLEARSRFEIPRIYRSYEELLCDPRVEAVYIPLPNSMHREWTLAAAAHGKHVLCEKPIGLNAGECREMIDGCAAHGVLLMEAFMYRFTERTRQVQAVLKSGSLGEIKFITASFRYPLANPASIKWKSELGGGSLYDVGCYPVNFAGMVADIALRGSGDDSTKLAVPESVSVASHDANGVDVIFSALLKYRGGLIASVHSGFNAQKRIVAEIIGTEGLLEVPDTFFDNAGGLVLTQGQERREIAIAASDRYRLEVEEFSDAIVAGRPPVFSMAETLRNTEVMDRLFALM